MIYIRNQKVDKDHVVGATVGRYTISQVADNNPERILMELAEGGQAKTLFPLIGHKHIKDFMGEYPVTTRKDLVGKSVYSYESNPNLPLPDIMALEPRVE
jgi:hypothetical protein